MPSPIDSRPIARCHLDGPLVRIRGFAVALTEAQKALRAALEGTIARSGPGGISPKALHTAHPEPEVPALLRLIEAEHIASQVAGVGWVASEVLGELRSGLIAWFESNDMLTPGNFKELTGLTRKAAIPLLEWLDRNRWTRRVGDKRQRGTDLTADQ